jgi:hypothetical protein
MILKIYKLNKRIKGTSSDKSEAFKSEGIKLNDMNNNEEFLKYMKPNRCAAVPVCIPIVPLDWVGTIFDRYEKQNYIVNLMASASVTDVLAIKDLGFCSVFAYCELVDIGKQNARLRIADPYSTMWTEYFKIDNKKDAAFISEFNGRMVRVLGHAENGKLKVDRVLKTKFKKYMTQDI